VLFERVIHSSTVAQYEHVATSLCSPPDAG